MKRHILFILILMGLSFSATVQAQSKREQRQAEKAERKQQEAAQQQKNHERLLALVEDKNFVLEAHTIYDDRQNSYPVSSNTNFVAITGDKATIQIAFPGRMGRNGLGGVTIQGNVMSYKVNHKKEGAIIINAQVSSASLGNATLILSIFNGGTARANIRGNFGSQVSFAGNVVDLNNSTVYQGMTDF